MFSPNSNIGKLGGGLCLGLLRQMKTHEVPLMIHQNVAIIYQAAKKVLN